MDESAVKLFRVAEHEIDGRTEDSRYPLAGMDRCLSIFTIRGETNAKSRMCLVEFNFGTSTVVRKHLNPPIEERFPWCEYVVRCGWMPSGERLANIGVTFMFSVWAQLLDRKQERIALVELPLSDFIPEDGLVPSPSHKILTSDTSPYWINVGHPLDSTNEKVSDLLHVFDDGRILWTSEASGFRHIYLLNPTLGQSTPLTSGAWQVSGRGNNI